jgi:hypothetical protein
MTQTLSPTSRRADPLLDADYRPLPGSPCLGAASDGGSIGAVQPEPASVDQAEYDELQTEYDYVLAEREVMLASLQATKNQLAFTEHIALVNAEERDAVLAEIARLRGHLTRAGAEVMAALEPGA